MCVKGEHIFYSTTYGRAPKVFFDKLAHTFFQIKMFYYSIYSAKKKRNVHLLAMLWFLSDA